MNHVFYSGYLSTTEVWIRCRLLNKEYFSMTLSIKRTSTLNTELFYTKGRRSVCCKCLKKRTMRKDPFQWVLGFRCQMCMPRTLCYTRAARVLREHNKNVEFLNSIRTIHKVSPYGRPMRLFLYADIIVLLK